MEITFEKWEDGRWFVVLPDYDGPQEDLEMVEHWSRHDASQSKPSRLMRC